MDYREGSIVVCIRHSMPELNGQVAQVVSVNLNGISTAVIDVGVAFPVLHRAYFGSIRKASDSEALAYRLGVRRVRS